jgi:hypothetical protein
MEETGIGHDKRIRRLAPSWWMVVGLGGIAIVSLSLDAWGLRPWGGIINYQRFGTWNEFLAGGATLAAVLVALGGMSIERRRVSEELERIRDRELTQVYAWLSPRRQASGIIHWYLNFENNTGIPVYEWFVHFSGGQEHACGQTNGPVRPHSSMLLLPDFFDLASGEMPRLDLVFVDSLGRSWNRGERGQLTPIAALAKCSGDHSIPELGQPRREWTQ